MNKANSNGKYKNWVLLIGDEKTGNSECTSAIESFRWPWRPKVKEFRLATNSNLAKVFGGKNFCNCDIYFEYGFDHTYFGHDWKYRFSGESVVPGGNNAIGTYKIENGKIIITSKKFTTFPKGAPNPYNTEEMQYYIDKKGDFGILQKYIYQKTNSAKIEN